MLRRVIWLLIGFPLALLLISLAVANRHAVRLVLDPFRPDAPALSLAAPFFVYLIAAMTLGVFIGGSAVWLGQSRWRRTARVRTADASRWQAEADRLARERDAQAAMPGGSKDDLTSGRRLLAVGRR